MGQGTGGEDENLFGVFSSSLAPSDASPLDPSALCVYRLHDLDKHINTTRDLCYTQEGRVEGVGEVAYIEYEVKSSCANLSVVRTHCPHGTGLVFSPKGRNSKHNDLDQYSIQTTFIPDAHSLMQ